VDAWRAHLNHATWPEVMRQFATAAGHGRNRPVAPAAAAAAAAPAAPSVPAAAAAAAAAPTAVGVSVHVAPDIAMDHHGLPGTDLNVPAVPAVPAVPILPHGRADKENVIKGSKLAMDTGWVRRLGQGITLVHCSAQPEPSLTLKTSPERLGTPSTPVKQYPLNTPCAQKALTLSRKVNECKPLAWGTANTIG
jgi:hypothetical protein